MSKQAHTGGGATALGQEVRGRSSKLRLVSLVAEAFSNIVKNSLEHTGEGGRIEITGEKNNFSTNIYIKDNGTGIEPEELGHIFERFYKGKNSPENSVGIGLALSKQLIMLQNGMVYVKSEPGKGTQFHVKMYSEVRI